MRVDDKMFRSGPDRVEYNWVGASRAIKFTFFSGLVRIGARYYGALRGRGAKNLAPQDSSMLDSLVTE